ncbi:MAG: hypothetical protein OFPI_12780 [Osedax symbiont Rs2]|nr:MAG: hypothetical protein OFPI_12780 [Osedax symbiont Rs2]
MKSYYKKGFFTLFALLLLLIGSSAFASNQLDQKIQNSDEIQWLALFLAGKKAGYSKMQRTVQNNTVTTTVTMQMQINRGAAVISIKSLEQSVETITGRALSFSSITEQGSDRVAIVGVISSAGVLDIQIQSSGQVVRQQQQWAPEYLLYEGQRLLALERGSKPGTRYQFQAYMIGALQATATKVVIGETVAMDLMGAVQRLSEVSQQMSMGATNMQMTVYMDRQMNLKKVIMPMMGSSMEMIASTEQYALSPNQPSDFFTATFTLSPLAISPKQAQDTLQYSIHSDSETIAFPATAEQSVSRVNNATELTISALKGDAGSYPYLGKDQAISQYLQPNRWVQNDDPQIIALAKQAAAGSRFTSEAAKNIENFVRSYISDKNLSVGYASAVQVLKSRQGDCTEHALLLAAMLKALGIPARVATGLAYVDNFSGQRQTFVPHAWAQALIQGQWRSYDAALSGFDSGHILLGFGDGDPMHFFSLVNSLGNFQIKSIRSQ